VGRAADAQLGEAADWRTLSPEDALPSLDEDPPDLILVGAAAVPGTLPKLDALLPAPDDPRRPAVILEGAASAQEAPVLAGPADDAIPAMLSAEERLVRVRTALRVRGYVSELGRKNAELEAVSERFERLARRMENELRLASHVQRSLLPPPFSHERLEVAREFLPFRQIGGDFYDVVSLDPNRLAFAIGDVMGKGVPAALLAASLKACLRAQLLADAGPPDEVVGRVNRLFCEVSPQGLFASLVFGVFDLDSYRFDYVNAGHHYPLLVSVDGSSRDLVEGGTVLGLLEDAHYSSASLQLDAGDLLVFYSDGVTDRANQAGDAFGLERLREAAQRNRHDSARIALYTLLGEVQGFSAGCPPNDDMTLVVARVR
jgi:serine phosphatase RsbU (regulator of sigma subunit)